jgi:hypothetical protein
VLRPAPPGQTSGRAAPTPRGCSLTRLWLIRRRIIGRGRELLFAPGGFAKNLLEKIRLWNRLYKRQQRSCCWLRKNAPKPQKGQNYHQWLTSQYGLKKLVEHIRMLVGVAKTCDDIHELKQRMEEMFGKREVQYVIRFKG